MPDASSTVRLAIFASGQGSNADAICRYFSSRKGIEVALIATTNPKAGVSDVAKTHNTPFVIFSKEQWDKPQQVIEILETYKIDYLILAGFLKLIPEALLLLYPNRIINIHPSLLPSFGGKGMYGRKVHEAVLAAGEKKTGISIHKCNAHYDEGAMYFQQECPVLPGDTAEAIGQRVRILEHYWYPRIIEKIVAEDKI